MSLLSRNGNVNQSSKPFGSKLSASANSSNLVKPVLLLISLAIASSLGEKCCRSSARDEGELILQEEQTIENGSGGLSSIAALPLVLTY
jgi:hypothetical protein